MSVPSLEQRVKMKAETQWRADFDAVINPLRDKVPDCLIEIDGRKVKAMQVFEVLTDGIFQFLLPQKQEDAVSAFLELVEKHKLEESLPDSK